MTAVAAIRELGKLLKKYPSEKLDITTVQRVAYVRPDALRILSAELPVSANLAREMAEDGERAERDLRPVIDAEFRVN